MLNVLLGITLVLLLLVSLVALYVHWLSAHKARPGQPRRRSKSAIPAHAEANDAAKLLSEVLALKQQQATWPNILQTLNPDDVPRIRTVLLELRGPHIFVPHTALNIIESTCLSAERPNNKLSRLDLLERAKRDMERVTRFGD